MESSIFFTDQTMADSALITNSDNANFKTDVLDSQIPVLVDFWAEWCQPCKMIAPVLEKVAPELEGKLRIVKVDIDANPELAQQYNVFSIPNLKFFNGGMVSGEISGFMPEPMLKAKINAELGKISEAGSMPMAA